MQNSILIKWGGCSLLFALVISCAPRRPIVAEATAERRVSRGERLAILRSIPQHQLDFTTFSGRAKSRIIINKDNHDVTANVRIERDKAIWISITALMGIEAGRVLITPDSIQVINRLQSEYVKKPFSYLHEFTSEAVDFASLQQLLVGNALSWMVDEDTDVWGGRQGPILRGEIEDLHYRLQLDSSFRALSTELVESAYSQRIEAAYADRREAVGGMTFPYEMNIALLADRLVLRASMTYSRAVYNESVDMPFGIPARYKEIQ